MARTATPSRGRFLAGSVCPNARIGNLPETNPANRAAIALTLAFLIARATTLSALFIGEVLGKMPCTLCWYQRIAMFPLVVILGVTRSAR